MELEERAKSVAEEVLSESLPRRWKHVQSVAGKARAIARLVPEPEQQVLIAAAWLHDVGYAPGIVSTGLHALDGARWLRRHHMHDRIVGLVAYHSCALFEAAERGLEEQLRSEFRDEESPLRDALWYADMTTGPDGQDLDVSERLAEIRSRYGPEHVVTRFWVRGEPYLIAAVRRTEKRLAGEA
ncbi:HD domain-containing protein [Micromonospora tulbaghiae]|uniref:HD domain-containing protein n=1 Tax=Micromonospora tulbaghiae TaxID=479978 RepID=UPI0029C15E8C|nr:HD domain-containing protein [Micromonospora tulbaghiae]MDX5460190.1 HD domain-containing protein [Micromonospora tulbaghiae]